MTFRSLSPLPVTVNKHQDRALTLVFGSDGQVSLIGFDGGATSQPLKIFTASDTGARSVPSGPSTVSPLPNLDVTTAFLSGASSSAAIPSSTPISPSASSSYSPLANATDSDTNLPSIPTVNYPTPTPTAVSNPKDHGVGAPFYLAIVLASVSLIGCVSAFIAWWIRSRSRKRDLELEDPWLHGNSASVAGSSTDEKGPQTLVGTQTHPYYLPASIVRRSSSSLLAVPHTVPASEDGTPQNATTGLDTGYRGSRPTNDPGFQNSNLEPNTSAASSRPGVERLQSELSVQESTHTLGRLRVANRVPGDITSGDEGGMNVSRLQRTAGLAPDTNLGKVNAIPAGQNAIQSSRVGSGGQPVTWEDGDTLEPPGPATASWGRRTDNVAALRRTRRRVPESAAQTYKNPLYGGHLYSTPDAGASDTARMPLARNDRDRAVGDSVPDSLRWTSTLKSSFWQAVDAMTGSSGTRSSDSEPRGMDSSSGSRFTPAPQRAASRRSPVSSNHLIAGASDLDTHAARSQETKTNHHNLTHLGIDSFLTGSNDLGLPRTKEGTIGGTYSLLLAASSLNTDSNTSTHQRHPDSLVADTGSLYSTDSAAARANLRKYGYGDPIPSTWSALAARRESQLDLARMFLPLPRLITSPGPSSGSGPLSITPSQVTLQSNLLSDSMSTHIRTPLHFDRDLAGSDNSTLRSGKTDHASNHGMTPMASDYSVSRDSTVQSAGRSAPTTVNALLQATSSTTSSLLSRRKGVATRRKRPSLPARAPSTASSVQSVESGLSIREVAVKRALLERRKKVKAAGSLKHREDHQDDGAQS